MRTLTFAEHGIAAQSLLWGRRIKQLIWVGLVILFLMELDRRPLVQEDPLLVSYRLLRLFTLIIRPHSQKNSYILILRTSNRQIGPEERRSCTMTR